eukprot:584090-Prymnesium_polylepis.1
MSACALLCWGRVRAHEWLMKVRSGLVQNPVLLHGRGGPARVQCCRDGFPIRVAGVRLHKLSQMLLLPGLPPALLALAAPFDLEHGLRLPLPRLRFVHAPALPRVVDSPHAVVHAADDVAELPLQLESSVQALLQHHRGLLDSDAAPFQRVAPRRCLQGHGAALGWTIVRLASRFLLPSRRQRLGRTGRAVAVALTYS